MGYATPRPGASRAGREGGCNVGDRPTLRDRVRFPFLFLTAFYGPVNPPISLFFYPPLRRRPSRSFTSRYAGLRAPKPKMHYCRVDNSAPFRGSCRISRFLYFLLFLFSPLPSEYLRVFSCRRVPAC